MPSNDRVIRIEWEGLQEFRDLLDNLTENMDNIIIEEYSRYGLLVEEGARSLAPHDNGDLEDSINFQRCKKVGNSFVVEGGSNLSYALVRHEAPEKSGTRPKYDHGAKFPAYYINGKGKRTRAKGSWRGKQAGRKFLTNAIEATKSDFDAMNERILTRIMNEGGRR